MSFELGATSPLETNEVRDVNGRSIRQSLMLLRRSLNPYDFYVVIYSYYERVGWLSISKRDSIVIPLNLEISKWRTELGLLTRKPREK